MAPYNLRSKGPIYVDFDLKNARVAPSGYVGVGCQTISLESEEAVEEMKSFTRVDWDGITSRPVLEKSGCHRLLALLAGVPPGPGWKNAVARINRRLRDGQEMINMPCGSQEAGNRGQFIAKPTGYTHGGGRTEPANINQKSKHLEQVMEGIRADEDVKKLAWFQSAAMASWAPKLYNVYRTCIAKTERRYPKLRRPFHDSIFPTLTINFGPRTVCQCHKDHLNLSFGFCAITPFGTFDPNEGGHIVLWEYKLIIRFPPGSTILIPSAIVTHGNTPIQDGEERYSFTQYAAGALFRWVDNDFHTEEDRWGGGPEGRAAIRAHHRAVRYWEKGMKTLRLEG